MLEISKSINKLLNVACHFKLLYIGRPKLLSLAHLVELALNVSLHMIVQHYGKVSGKGGMVESLELTGIVCICALKRAGALYIVCGWRLV